jgi:hypothetical protein
VIYFAYGYSDTSMNMEKYAGLFDLNRYLDEVEVCYSKVLNSEMIGGPYCIPESICSRIIFIGIAYKLHYVPMINIYGDISLNKTQCYTLIEELLFIKSIVIDEIIEYFVPPLIKLLEEITRTHIHYYLCIMGN